MFLKKATRKIWFMFCVTLLLTSATLLAQTDLYAPFNQSVPVIDGTIGTGEWVNASSNSLTFYYYPDSTTMQMPAWFQNDGTYLYVAAQAPFPTNSSFWYGLYFDGDHSHTLHGSFTEPHITVNYNKAGTNSPLYSFYDEYRIIQSGCATYSVAPPAGAQHAFSGSDPMSFEFRVPLSDLTVQSGGVVGFAIVIGVDATSGNNWAFPVKELCNDLSQWANLWIQSNAPFCEDFDSPGTLQNWHSYYGSQEFITVPTHNSSTGAVQLYGTDAACGSSMWKSGFSGSYGEYSYWFRHDYYHAEPRIYVMVDTDDTAVDPVSREGYMLSMGAVNGHPVARYIRIAHVNGSNPEQFLTSTTPTQFPMNTWVRGYIRIEEGGRIVAGYEWEGGSDQVVCYDPNPITRSGLFLLYTCAPSSSPSNIYDDVCYSAPDTLRIGQGTDCLLTWEPTEQVLPIYLDNRDTVKAGDIPLCYDWSFDPDSISFVGTRLASMDFKTRTIDAMNNSIRIGFVADFGGSGNVLAPIDDVTRETPIAKVFFHRPYVCAEAWVQPPDTCSVVLEADVISLELIDKFDQPYMPIVLRDSTKALPYRPGDCDMSGSITVSDAVCMISYVFSGGSASCLGSFDANCDGSQTISDPVYVINYIFGSGPVPGSNCLCGASPFAKTTIGHADISTASTSGEDIHEIAVNLDASSDSRAVQLDFAITGDVRNIQIKSNVSDLQLFSSEVDGGYRMGLIDLTGTATIPSGNAQIAVITYEGDGELSVSSAIVVDNDATEMNVEITNSKLETVLPTEYSLGQNQPNPFNPSTDISFSLPIAGQVKLVVYNILGAEVATLVDEVRSAGVHRVSWNGTNSSGQQVASGIYLYRLTAGDFAATKKMLLLK